MYLKSDFTQCLIDCTEEIGILFFSFKNLKQKY